MEAACTVEEFEMERDDCLAVEGAGGRGLHGHDLKVWRRIPWVFR